MRKSHFFAMIAGLVLMFGGPAAGLFFTAQRMRRAIEVAQGGQADGAARLAAELSRALAAIHLGLTIGVAGLLILLSAIALHFATRRARATPPAPRGAR